MQEKCENNAKQNAKKCEMQKNEKNAKKIKKKAKCKNKCEQTCKKMRKKTLKKNATNAKKMTPVLAKSRFWTFQVGSRSRHLRLDDKTARK